MSDQRHVLFGVLAFTGAVVCGNEPKGLACEGLQQFAGAYGERARADLLTSPVPVPVSASTSTGVSVSASGEIAPTGSHVYRLVASRIMVMRGGQR